jgi:hypothetical protein
VRVPGAGITTRARMGVHVPYTVLLLTCPRVRGRKGDMTMKYAISCLIVCVTMMVSAIDANAVVCARGVYRAGCVGPGGAAVVHRPVGCAWVRGVRVCR